VWCLEDSDCGGATPACNAAAGVCVECLSDPHCALLGDVERQRCNVPAQRCQQCLGNSDCPLGERCELSEGHCEAGEVEDD
jgi:Cys-rich repeat protein